MAGAVGDCLGAATEFKSLESIYRHFGPAGLTEIHPPGRFTDDTQMTLFTVVGVVRALLAENRPSSEQWTNAFHVAYLEWLRTQEVFSDTDKMRGSWLVHESTMYRREAPGHTCLSALRSGETGTLQYRLNDSMGCGGVIRAAPVGLLLGDGFSRADRYEVGCLSAAVTHGHDGGIHPAGAFAAMVGDLLCGATIEEAVVELNGLIPNDLQELLDFAVEFGSSGAIEPMSLCDELGQGWVGDEALAVAVACAVSGPDIETALLASINHDGDTDSTGSICGNLIGAMVGINSVPKRWIDDAAQSDLIRQVGADCVAFLDGDRSPLFSARYA